MNASLLAVLNDAERLLVAETGRAELAALDEDAAIELETRVSDRTAFYSVLRDEKSDTRTGVLVEYGMTEQIFQDPQDSRTKAYVTGRMG